MKGERSRPGVAFCIAASSRRRLRGGGSSGNRRPRNRSQSVRKDATPSGPSGCITLALVPCTHNLRCDREVCMTWASRRRGCRASRLFERCTCKSFHVSRSLDPPPQGLRRDRPSRPGRVFKVSRSLAWQIIWTRPTGWRRTNYEQTGRDSIREVFPKWPIIC